MNYHYRPSLRGTGYLGSVFLRVICDRVVRNVTLSWKVYPSEWSGGKNDLHDLTAGHWLRIDPLNSRAAKIRRMENEMQKMLDYLQDMAHRWESEDREITADAIVAACHRLSGKSRLWDFTRKVADHIERNGQIRTAQAYRSAVRRLCDVVGHLDLELREVTSFLLRRFQDTLQKEGKSLNTISFYMRNLRAIRNRAIVEGLLEDTFLNPFERVYTGVETTRKKALTKDDVKLLQGWKPLTTEKSSAYIGNAKTQEGLRSSQQYFLFSLYARGMSFVDLAYLKKESIKEGVMRYRRKKTGQLLEVKLNSQMRRIISYFANETKDSPYVFPIIRRPGCNERLQYESGLRLHNKRLKRIAKDCQAVEGGEKSELRISGLASHAARHTWATLARHAHIPLLVISEALGHTSEKTTAIYLASLDRSYLDKANDKVLRAIKSMG